MAIRKIVKRNFILNSSEYGSLEEYLKEITFHGLVAKQIRSTDNVNKFYEKYESELFYWIFESIDETGLAISELLNVEEKDILLKNNLFKKYFVQSFYEQVANEMLDGMEL